MNELIHARRFGRKPPRRNRLAMGLLAVLVCAAWYSPATARDAKTAVTPREQTAPGYGEREDVRQFAEELTQRHGWRMEDTMNILAKARHQARVTQLIMPPPAGTAKNWAAYRSRFVEPKRLKAGLEFWNANDRLLKRAERVYGVPASLIVGIIGVETYYGRHMGGFRVLDALTTLSFDFPSGRSDRSAFFRSELEALLVWARKEGRAPQDVKGSYAGAIGWPQFMPSSILRHAVDFDGDGHINLERNMADVIGSVANFLKNHGWTPGLPTHYSVEPPIDEAALAELLVPDIVPSFSASDLAAKGAVLGERALAHPGPLALVALQNGQAAPSYVAGTSNFYAVTRYNWSSYYALAVIELGREVQEARLKAASAARQRAR
ncbi:MAG: lytic murein transglycosylase B [Betaproteobacteria bacterium]